MPGRGAIALGFLLGGCASSSLTLLPDEGGGQGAVAVLESGGVSQETVVGIGNSQTKLGTRNPRPNSLSDKRRREVEAGLVGQLPPPAKDYELFFEEGTARLTAASRPQLTALLADVASRSGVEVQVTGHADRVGSFEDNDRLSEQRARAILEILVREGIPREVMIAVGRGERDLKQLTRDGVGAQANRRVEVTVR